MILLYCIAIGIFCNYLKLTHYVSCSHFLQTNTIVVCRCQEVSLLPLLQLTMQLMLVCWQWEYWVLLMKILCQGLPLSLFVILRYKVCILKCKIHSQQERNQKIILHFPYVDMTFIISCRMSQYLEDQKESVLQKGDKLEKLGWQSYLNSSS